MPTLRCLDYHHKAYVHPRDVPLDVMIVLDRLRRLCIGEERSRAQKWKSDSTVGFENIVCSREGTCSREQLWDWKHENGVTYCQTRVRLGEMMYSPSCMRRYLRFSSRYIRASPIAKGWLGRSIETGALEMTEPSLANRREKCRAAHCPEWHLCFLLRVSRW